MQAWLPVHQIFQGNCGGATVPEVLEWSGLRDGDSGEYLTSADKALWDKWHAEASSRPRPPWLVSDGGQGALRLLLPAKDRQENFGDDLLVNVLWAGNVLICAPMCVRVPAAMTWAEFRGGVIDPWADADPDYDPASVSGWQSTAPH